MMKTLPENAILIPDNAQPVFKGEIFDVYQWPQKMFDGSIKTFEMLKRPDTPQVIAVENDRIVVINDEQPGRKPQLHVPGGRADEHDGSWLVTAKRELLEETGKVFKSWRLLQVYQPAVKIEWFTPIYLATELESNNVQSVDNDGERISVELQTYQEVQKRTLDGVYPAMSYLMPLFAQVSTLEELLDLPEFKGQEVDR